MANAAGKIVMKVLTIAIGIPVGKATKKAVDQTWARTRGDVTARDPKSSSARWVDAIGWAALSAAGMTLAQLATRKGAEQTFKAVLGVNPPPPPPGKAEKKAAKAAKAQAKAAAVTA
jgi:hypothetical protein